MTIDAGQSCKNLKTSCKMKLTLLRLFLLRCHFIGILASPLPQYEDGEEVFVVPDDLCYLPPELGTNGK